MRLHSHMWVSAFIRQVNNGGASAMLTRRGEATAGAIYIKVALLNRTAHLYSPAPLFLIEENAKHNSPAPSLEHDRCWHLEFGTDPLPEYEIDQFIQQQTKYDADIWVIEIEDTEGRHFLDDQLIDTN